MSDYSQLSLSDAVARAKAKIAAQREALAKKNGEDIVLNRVQTPLQSQMQIAVPGGLNNWIWNQEQATAITQGIERKTFCLIGAAGVGKTTTLKGMVQEMLHLNKIPPLESGTANLNEGAPGIVFVSYTRRAVRNIARQMPADLKSHCLTIHKLLEFAPEFYDVDIVDEKTGRYVETVKKMRFAPQKHEGNPLPSNLLTVVVDEASMVDMDLADKLMAALRYPARVQFIILGDLNQLPPIYGQPILGHMLLTQPIVELTQVYRQALESPIIALALAVKNNNFKSFNQDAIELWGGPEKFDVKELDKSKGPVRLHKEGRGTVTLHPWKIKWGTDEALTAMMGQIGAWITAGTYLPDEDLILCPWNESFGTIELNKSIANKLGRARRADVYEIIAGYNKYYYAVGDKILVEKYDAIILEIKPNYKYIGKRPGPHSPYLDRWGKYQKAVTSDDIGDDRDVDAILDSLSTNEDRTAEASHILKVKILDTDEEVTVSKSAVYNASVFAYALTVHKAQGSECRKVFFITHYCHSAMLSRELVYTAITRAAEELYVIMSPHMLSTAAARPRVKGDTLAAKLAWYKKKMEERLLKKQVEED